MGRNVTEKLIADHLVSGRMKPGEEIGIRIDQTLTQDATGTLVMLELESMGLDRIRTELSVQYVDHNLIQEDHKNPDDHLFLLSAARRFGVWFSRAGNGVSHPVHQEYFGKPGKTLAGSDSHTPAAGAIGMFAVGAGGLEVAGAMAGEPLFFKMPEVWGIRLEGALPDWVSAKDVILELLRRHGVRGGVERVLEYGGPGLRHLSAMDRHVIANMGTELGATTSVFPSDGETRRFLAARGREEDWKEILADGDAGYDIEETVDLSSLEPLIAMPSSPGNVRPVREVAGTEVYQCYVGSSANPGYRDFAITAEIVKGKQVHPRVSLDVNPTSRVLLGSLTRDGHLLSLIQSGARIHQAGCNGCIGMGQAPATGKFSLRTVPRNFPGRSGTREDLVCLVSPETAAASALHGAITDPRTLGEPYPKVREPDDPPRWEGHFVPPLPPEEARRTKLEKGPDIASLPELDAPPDDAILPVLLKVGDDVSTDEILPAGTRALPFRSNIPKISRFAFDRIDPDYHDRALAVREKGGHFLVAGSNYGQGSSREHAALAPRYLGLRAVIAVSYARIHKQNLVNFGVLPLVFTGRPGFEETSRGDIIELTDVHRSLREGGEIRARNRTKKIDLALRCDLSGRQVEVLLEGGLIRALRRKLREKYGDRSRRP
ncbi:MAG: aconitate hydratase [Candidatus Latescibacterota bacterium]|nr:MAG: aconitate hydratase [Candidatus Latescibacterota bacterium]